MHQFRSVEWQGAHAVWSLPGWWTLKCGTSTSFPLSMRGMFVHSDSGTHQHSAGSISMVQQYSSHLIKWDTLWQYPHSNAVHQYSAHSGYGAHHFKWPGIHETMIWVTKVLMTRCCAASMQMTRVVMTKWWATIITQPETRVHGDLSPGHLTPIKLHVTA